MKARGRLKGEHVVTLRIKRNQATKFFGGVKFTLDAQAKLTQDEQDLVNKYKVQDEVLAKKAIKIPLTDRALVVDVTIASLTAGQTFKCNDISEILGYEEAIKGSCAELYQRLTVMRTFGGEEVIQFSEEGAKLISSTAAS
jgi:hypothetical protein